MSDNIKKEQIHSQEEEVEEEVDLIDVQEVDEVVDDSELNDEPMDDDEQEEEDLESELQFDENGNIEIDMSNNSQSYFDSHTDSIFTISTHPTLPIAMTGGGDNVAYLWTTHSSPSKTITKLAGFTESVIASSFTFDGSYLITGDMTGKVIVFKSTKKGQSWVPFDRILEDVSEISWIKAHPKQNIFAFGGVDGSVIVYQIEPNLEMIFSGFSHSTDCTGGEFVQTENTDELKLVTISEDGSIIGWNCFTQQTEFKLDSTVLKGLTPPWVSIAANSTGKLVSVGSRDSQVAIINTETGALLTFFKALELKETDDIFDASIETLAWCDTLNLMALGLVSGDIYIFDTTTWKVRKTLKCDDAITKLIFIKNSPILIGSSMNGKVYKWDSRTGELLLTCVGHHMGVLDFSIDCSGERLTTAGDDGVSLVFNIK